MELKNHLQIERTSWDSTRVVLGWFCSICINTQKKATSESSCFNFSKRSFLHRFPSVWASRVPLWNRLFGVRWICRGGQLTAIQDAASRTPREECPAALGQAGRPGPDGGPVHGAIAEPHQSVSILRGLGHLLPLHELLRWGWWRWVGNHTHKDKTDHLLTCHLSAGSVYQTSVLYKSVTAEGSLIQQTFHMCTSCPNLVYHCFSTHSKHLIVICTVEISFLCSETLTLMFTLNEQGHLKCIKIEME